MIRVIRTMRRSATRLWWWALDYAYVVAQQARAAFDRTDPAMFLDGPRAPVVVIPGVYEPWRFMLPLIRTIHAMGHPVHVLDPLGFNRKPVPDAAAHLVEALERQDLEDVIIVAHSKGGLVGKYAMTQGAGVPRIRSMLAVATPFGGSSYARLLFTPSLRIFSPRDRTILALSLEKEVNSRIVSVFGCFDPHIPKGSFLLGAENVQLDTGGHFRVLEHPRVLVEFERLAAQPAEH
ncbi:triacylglycerol lipase [Pseudoclavibacter sp. RFBA6]|uniref:esterase/lipase family protein n=1 Tax=Pseudoclavibacter sp. RFBA6 TaxID=2080573 RepID=UPI0021586CD4|nr:alpha/beta hydrolase [Pseudoclavibacter sp. RFBA6]